MPTEEPKIDEIYLSALQKPEGERREAFLDDACGADTALRARVQRLLGVQDKANSFLESPAPGIDLSPTVEVVGAERTGSRIGSYKLLQRLGEGGMGEVFMAQQTEPVERLVAVKVIKPGMDSRQVIARFEAERQALAMMDHPNIAKVYDAGTTESGRPYFVMELVKGKSITEYCDDHRLDLRRRLKLFRSVCHAVQHAHQKGIIHRDIKPSNVLVAEYDDEPVPKVIDFGVAKAIQQRLTSKTMFTEVGTVLGTIDYMSPEQAKLNQLDIDTRSDIYSLGVLLYELLTGATPFDRERLRNAALDQVLRIIREEEPARPSVKLTTSPALPAIAANRLSNPKQLGVILNGELDWIVMKALAKERTRRYESANLLASDISRYLAGDVVEASSPTLAYRLSKTWQRHKLPIAGTAALLAALVLGLIVVSTLWVQARTLAEDLKEASSVITVTNDALENKNTELKSERDRARKRLYAANMQNALTAWNGGFGGWRTMDRTLGEYEDSPLRGWEYFFLKHLRDSASDPLVFKTRRPIRLAVSPDGETIVATHTDGHAISLTTSLKGGQAAEFGPMEQLPWVHHFAEFANHQNCILHSDNDCRTVLVRSTESLNDIQDKLVIPAEIADQPCTIRNAVFSNDDSMIFLFAEDGKVIRYDRQTKRFEQLDQLEPIDEPNQCVPLSLMRDGSQLAVAQRGVFVIDVDSGERKYGFELAHSQEITCMVEIPEMNWIATGSRDRTVIFSDMDSGEEMKKIGPLEAEVRSLAYDQTNERLAAGCRDGTVRIWSLPTFTKLPRVRGFNVMYGLRFNHDGTLLYGADDGVRARDLFRDAAISRITLGSRVLSLRFDPTSMTVVARIANDPAVQLINVETRAVRTLNYPGVLSRRIKNSSVLAIADRGKLFLVDYLTGQIKDELDLPDGGKVTAVDFSPDFTSVALGYEDGRVGRVSLTTRESSIYRERGEGQVRMLDFLSDGSLITAHHYQGVSFWQDGQILRTHGPFHSWVSSLCCDEDKIAFGLFKRYRDFQVQYGNPRESLLKLDGNISNSMGIAFIENGKTLVTAGADHELKLWDLESGESRFTISDIEIYSAMAVSPDERLIAVGTREGSVIIYRADLPSSDARD